jgi:predicted nucleotidyltransferase
MDKIKITVNIKSVLEDNNNIVFAFLFGSIVRNKMHYSSDIDIGIYFKNKPALFEIGNLNLKIEEAVNHKIDLVELNYLDKNDPVLAYNILSEGILIVNNDIKIFNDYKKSVLLKYLDFKPTNDLINESFNNRLSNNRFAVFEK